MLKQFFLLLTATLLYSAEIELEVLGSGGPEIDGRASTSYLLWVDNKARLIVDMGSGSMLRFEEEHAKLEDLEAVVLTHLHIDHSVDLPSFVKAGYFSQRRSSLDIIGPDDNWSFPSTSEYLDTLFGKNGAYRYMKDVLDEDSDSFQIIPFDIDEKTTKRYRDFTLTLIPVYHGNVPALALRIDVAGKSILISGDTNDKNKNLEKIAQDVDLFVAHHAIPEHAQGYATQLHMTPNIIANIANSAHVKRVLLTHRMNRTIGSEKESLRVIQSVYKGRVDFAEDKMKIKL